jgi:hypothetical protein
MLWDPRVPKSGPGHPRLERLDENEAMRRELETIGSRLLRLDAIFGDELRGGNGDARCARDTEVTAGRGILDAPSMARVGDVRRPAGAM